MSEKTTSEKSPEKEVLEVHLASEFASGPEVAVVEMTSELRARIEQLSAAARELGATRIMVPDHMMAQAVHYLEKARGCLLMAER